MTTSHAGRPKDWQWLAAVIAACALGAGCATFERSVDAPRTRAQALADELDTVGVTVSPAVAGDLFGADGGHLCAAAATPGALANVALAGHRFALRKTTVDTGDVTAARTVIEVSCPQHLDAFDAYVDGLATGDVDSG